MICNKVSLFLKNTLIPSINFNYIALYAAPIYLIGRLICVKKWESSIKYISNNLNLNETFMTNWQRLPIKRRNENVAVQPGHRVDFTTDGQILRGLLRSLHINLKFELNKQFAHIVK